MTLFILLNLIDSILTYVGIKSGKADEGNLLLANIFNNNIIVGLTLKMLLAIAIAILVLKFKKHLFKVLNIVFIAICVWNLIIIVL